MTDQKLSLEEIKARRENLKQALEATIKEQSANTNYARELQALEDDEALEQLLMSRDISRMKILETPLGRIIVGPPDSILFRAYQDKGKTDSETLDRLVRRCLLHPSPARYSAIMEEYPGAPLSVVGLICMLAGTQADEVTLKSES